jgi:hypothetical protein
MNGQVACLRECGPSSVNSAVVGQRVRHWHLCARFAAAVLTAELSYVFYCSALKYGRTFACAVVMPALDLFVFHRHLTR